jgi:hypothetical protein
MEKRGVAALLHKNLQTLINSRSLASSAADQM